MTGNITKDRVGIVQRALQLASEGKLKTVSDIQTALIREGYDLVPQYLAGLSIRRQIKAAIRIGAGAVQTATPR